MREFTSGATRNDEGEKLDYEGFLNPLVLGAFAQYMHGHRTQADGQVRSGDNWQKGIPRSAYQKSMTRHFMDCWGLWRGLIADDQDSAELVDSLCALFFNVQGLLLEVLLGRDLDQDPPATGPLRRSVGFGKP
jgi:hypothetical protein